MTSITISQNRLRNLRVARGMKQVEMASRAGVGVSTINRLERWQFAASVPIAKRLAAALGVEVSEAFPYLTETGAK